LRQNSTDVEARLWAKLRGGRLAGHSFRRQPPVGPYVLDFYAPSLRLAIELDGGQHNEAEQQHRDQKRDAWFAERGVMTLRFSNADVMANLPGVLDVIASTAEDRKTSELTPTRRWRADLPLSGGGAPPQTRG
jgi:very-short-patch-repair endonuclease